MIQAKLAWAAFKNMLRTAKRDPLWAVVALATGPFRAGRYMLQVGAKFLLVLLVVGFGSQYLMDALGVAKGDALRFVDNWLFTVFIVLFLFRLMTGPMIQHFGDMASDTHGSARFAANKEIALLIQMGDGLLIGRDAKTGKLCDTMAQLIS